MRFADIIYSFPALSVLYYRDGSAERHPDRQIPERLSDLIRRALAGWLGGVARLVRGQVLALKEKDFVLAAQALGVRQHQILLRHLLPNALGPIIIAGAFIVPGAIIAEAVLSYSASAYAQPPTRTRSSRSAGEQ